jgi:hypothetical protein
MGGSDVVDQQGTYGTLNVPDASNIPTSRYGAVSWTDLSGNFWIFVGISFSLNGSIVELNDLWKFSNGA